MACPRATEIEDPSAPGKDERVVAPYRGDGAVVDVGYESGRGVEVGVGGGVGAGEVGGVVGPGFVARGVGGYCGWGEGGCHCCLCG